MQVRDANISDIPHLTELWLEAIHEIPKYGTVYPWGISDPVEFRRVMMAEITDIFLRGKERYLVVETTDTEQRQITAWASWTRNGSSAAARKIRSQNDSLLKSTCRSPADIKDVLTRIYLFKTNPVLERSLCALEEAICFPFIKVFSLPTTPCGDVYLGEWCFKQYVSFLKRLWIGDIEEHWFVQKLCVAGKWRRRGIATMLLRWGMDRARKEGVVVRVVTTEPGMPLYMKAGFVQIAVFEQEDLDVRTPVLLWRPEII